MYKYPGTMYILVLGLKAVGILCAMALIVIVLSAGLGSLVHGI